MKKLNNEDEFTENLYNISSDIQDLLEFEVKDEQIYAKLNNKEFQTLVYPKKLVRKYLKNFYKKDNDISAYFIENDYQTREEYLDELGDVYTWALYRLTDDESGVQRIEMTLEDNMKKWYDLKTALKVIRKNMKEILETEILSDVDLCLDSDREHIYRTRFYN